MVSGNSMSIIWYGETIVDLENGVGQPFDTGWFSQTVESSNNGFRELYVHNTVRGNHLGSREWFGITMQHWVVLTNRRILQPWSPGTLYQ